MEFQPDDIKVISANTSPWFRYMVI